MKGLPFIISILHLLAAGLTGGYALHLMQAPWSYVYGAVSFVMLLLAFTHQRLPLQRGWRLALVFIIDALFIGLIAWQYYHQQQQHPATFIYEGFAVFFASIAVMMLLQQAGLIFSTPSSSSHQDLE